MKSIKLAAVAALTVALSAITVPAPQQAVAAPSAPSAPSAAAAAAEGEQPNILLITSDDQNDFELKWMPKTMRLLAGNGINFTDGLNPHPICCPARAEILTGEYGHNNGVHHNSGPWGGYSALVNNGWVDQNIGSWLSDAGYKTAFIGKPLNNYQPESRRLEGWDTWNPTVNKSTYAYYGTEFLDDDGVGTTTYNNKYVADVVRDKTKNLISSWSRTEEPFFIWASHVGPHGAHRTFNRQRSTRVGGRAAAIPADRHVNSFADLAFPVRNKPSYREVGRSVRDKPAPIVDQSREQKQSGEFFQRRVESLQAIDEANAASIRALRNAGELDNTVVVYVSDNGYQLGEHGLEGKNYVYQENLQIPFLMRAPDMAGGRQLNMAASLVDLAPTFLDYAGAGVLEAVRQKGYTDGLSLRGVVAQGRMPNDTTLIQAGDPKLPWLWRGVRTSRYTYAEWSQGYYELYDRKADRFELDNLVGPGTGRLQDRRYRAVLFELKQRYRALKGCSGVAECESQRFGRMPRVSRRG